MSRQQPPILQLDFPSSPLLSSSSSETAFSASILSCLPVSPFTLSSANSPVEFSSDSSLSTASSSISIRTPKHLIRSVPHITITRPVSDQFEDKPLPALPSSLYTRAPDRAQTLPLKKVMDLLDLLDRFDRDVASEVRRVERSIKEAEAEVAQWKEERRLRELESARQRESES
ncbi:hypothetical protein EW146_g4083 [Bondarzewia mesenterica]|uniref:Uncharacterized protein n=1 Tax=Bondarzewia mesenterica TaxID=1095465 RepID=A0A4S4LVS6_9AGAM|nr:hypothetical protein EW146_g4083 [Bondarzewia mesenterica]